MAGTLVIDHDGVYDPCLLNDRLLLGLKGTMSEFEISLLRQRAMEAHRQKVRRGLVMTQVLLATSAQKMKASRRRLTDRYRKLSRVFSASSANWVVYARCCSGIGKRSCRSRCCRASPQPQGRLGRAGLPKHLRHSEEPHICRRLRLGQEADTYFHRRRPCP